MSIAKLVAMQRLTTLLEGITDFTYTDASGVPQTVTYDLIGRVYRGRKTVSADDALDSMSILEAPRATIGNKAGQEGALRDETWTLNLQGWPREDREHPSDPAYVMAAAARERLGWLIDRYGNSEAGEPGAPKSPAYHMLGGAAHAITFGGTIVSPASQDLSAVAFWYIPIVISLVQRT